MFDPRVRRLAETVVDFRTDVKESDTVQIRAWSDLAKPLMVEIFWCINMVSGFSELGDGLH